MATNNDGLEAGQVVDFATLQRVKREHAKRLNDESPKADSKPKRRTSKPKPKGNGRSVDYAVSRVEGELPTESAD